jgi:hypothetical protein
MLMRASVILNIHCKLMQLLLPLLRTSMLRSLLQYLYVQYCDFTYFNSEEW